MAESKEPVEELDLDEELEQQASGAGNASGDTLKEDAPMADFGDLLEEESGFSGEKGGDDGGDMDLTELEAFLDDFNRSIDDDEEAPETADALSVEDSGSAKDSSAAEEDRADPAMSEAEAEMMKAAAEDPGASIGDQPATDEPEDAEGMSEAEAEMVAAAAEDPGSSVGEAGSAVESEEAAGMSEAEAEMMAASAEDPGASIGGESPDNQADDRSGPSDTGGEAAVAPEDAGAESPEREDDEASDWERADESPAADLAEDELDLSFGERSDGEENKGGSDDEFEELDLDAFDSEQPETPEQSPENPAPVLEEAPSDSGPPDDLEAMDPGATKSPDGEAGASRGAATPATATPPSTGTGKVPLIAAILAGIGLLMAGGAGYVAFGLNSEVERINRSIEALEPSGSRASGVGDLGERVDQALRETKKLGARLSELAIIIEGPMSHLRESNERDVKNLSMRIEQLESSLESVKQKTAALADTSRAAQAKPAAASSDWAVNLVSLSNRRTAEQERQRLAAEGIETVLRTARVGGRTWHRLQVGGFGSKAEAEAYLSRVKSIDGLDGAWVTH